ncbi:hypothetical protein [Neptuniibacter sp. QD37_11]|uniref:hypothetical protein n=1 Tax=Neptuniibacter sp. QD37_11 TaxID=3398209 RepID=UPI0039F57711
MMPTKHKQRGEISPPLVFAISLLLAIGYVIYAGYGEQKRHEKIETLLNTPKEPTLADLEQLAHFKTIPTPDIRPDGLYWRKVDDSGQCRILQIFFKKDWVGMELKTILKGFDQRKILGKAEAKYHSEGSVMHFSDIKGNLSLFAPKGQAYSVPTENTVELAHTDSNGQRYTAQFVKLKPTAPVPTCSASK